MWVIVLLGVIAILVFLVKELFFPSESKNKKEEDYEEKMQELDEELEDYDYLDDITGKEDKPWI
ncbi:MAG: hypothetical protein DRP68_06415 [Candidatus Omnitrophota bacterium]|nr:MAG: hypothetical protein DRP68_06415 [Candidatus Omnitrophota bacterium]HDN85709.1 hypothetical protein [Candidatus Omnitrophota bacterium]